MDISGTTNNPLGIATFGNTPSSGPQISGSMGPANNPQQVQGSQVDPTYIPSGAGMTNTAAVLGANTAVDPAAAQAASQAAADAAKAASLRGQVSDLVNQIKSIFNTRYGQVDAQAGEQAGKLNDRFTNESQDLAQQVTDENNKVGAAHAAGGTYDSSYRGNNVDTVTRGGQAQARDLGQELQDNIAKIAAWVATQKAGFDAKQSEYDAVNQHLGEETDPGRLTDLRNTQITNLAEARAGSADYNTAGANAQALESIAPSSPRTIQLKTTLSQIIAGNADPSQKAAIGQSLITNSGISPTDQQQLLQAFQSDLTNKPQTA